MKVELRQHWGFNCATGKREQLPQYRVFLDGSPIGFLGWRSDKVCLVQRLGPIERAAIERAVKKQTDMVVTAVIPPNVPASMFEQEEDVFEEVDDHA